MNLKRCLSIVIFSAAAAGTLLAQQQEPAPPAAAPTHRHLIRANGPLTAASPRPAAEIAREFTAQSVAVTGVDPDSLYTAKEYTDDHNGVTHIVYRQQFEGIDVQNASWVVNIDRDGRVLNAGGALYPRPTVGPASMQHAMSAARAAVQGVNPSLAARFEPFPSEKPEAAAAATKGAVRYAAGPLGSELEGRIIWYAVRGLVQPAWLFQVTDSDGVRAFDVVIDDATNQVLDKQAASFFQTAAKGLVFERDSPNPVLNPGTLATEPAPLADRTMQPFTGDSVASPRGWTDAASRTAGNNAIVGENLLGLTFLLDPGITTAPGGDFSFPLLLGPGDPATTLYKDAVNTNLFYWVNRAHDLFYGLGFNEAAGNFQADNFGRGGNGGDPMYAYSHYGVQAPNRSAAQNAFFTRRGLADGSQSMIAMYISFSGSGGFYTDGALDSSVILHEYTHGVTNRLLPLGYDTFQVSSMGEAWSDYFALDFLMPANAPPDGAYTIGDYFVWAWGQGIRTRPYTTDMKVNSLTYRDMGKVVQFPEVHSDGEIWMESLWEMRANLIQQFGDKEGRRRAGLLILDGVKLMPPGSTMVDARDAILLADRTNFSGASQSLIWSAFAKRGLGATAWSANANSVHVHPSFAVPSGKGKVEFYESQITIGEPLRMVVSDANASASAVSVQVISSSGDHETVSLKRTGSIFAGTLGTNGNAVALESGILNVTPGDVVSVFYDDPNDGAGAFAQISAAIPASPSYFASGIPAAFDATGTETPVQDSTRVELPFAFPFFENSYRSVYVSSRGILKFTDTEVTGCTDLLSLRAMPAIAPFFMQLTTLGSAQPREGIFYRQIAPNAVRFRWAAETVTGFPLGSPVNFSVTLQDDGVIEFAYGAGNTDLQNAVTVAGCSGGVSQIYPTVGLSSGHETYSLGTYIKQSWTNTAGFHFDPPFNQSSDPKVILEAPAPDGHVQDVMTVSGIAYDDATFLSRSYVLIDGKQMGSTNPNVVRPDFCAKQNVRGCPVVGFSLNIPTAGMNPGVHTLQVRAINARGSITTTDPVSFTIDPGQGRLPFGAIESPAAGAEVSGNLTVRGYAAITDLRVAGVDTVIDGVTYGPTIYGLARPDICGALDPRPVNCPAIGFQLSINTRTGLPPLSDGPHTLQIRVRDESGRNFFLPDSVAFTVKNGAYQPPQGAITSVKSGDVLSGSVTVSGYAYSPGSAIQQVFLVWDNEIAQLARYGLPAADVCAALPDVVACPNIGWSVDFDTKRLNNGPHILNVFLRNQRGDSLYLPSVGQKGISVTVQN